VTHGRISTEEPPVPRNGFAGHTPQGRRGAGTFETMKTKTPDPTPAEIAEHTARIRAGLARWQEQSRWVDKRQTADSYEIPVVTMAPEPEEEDGC
jgi:hypothetical protein